MLAVSASVVLDELVDHGIVRGCGHLGQLNRPVEAGPDENVVACHIEGGPRVPSQVLHLGPVVGHRDREPVAVEEVEDHRLLRAAIGSQGGQQRVAVLGGKDEGAFEIHDQILKGPHGRSSMQILTASARARDQLAVKFGLSMNPMMVPSGAVTTAVMIPSPTSDTGVCTVHPFSTASATADGTSATPQ